MHRIFCVGKMFWSYLTRELSSTYWLWECFFFVCFFLFLWIGWSAEMLKA